MFGHFSTLCTKGLTSIVPIIEKRVNKIALILKLISIQGILAGNGLNFLNWREEKLNLILCYEQETKGLDKVKA